MVVSVCATGTRSEGTRNECDRTLIIPLSRISLSLGGTGAKAWSMHLILTVSPSGVVEGFSLSVMLRIIFFMQDTQIIWGAVRMY